MKMRAAFCVPLLFLVGCASTGRYGTGSARDEPLLAVTPAVERYAREVVSPRLPARRNQDTLAQLLVVSKTLIDPHDGVSSNRMEPGKFMGFNMLGKVGLGAVSMIGLSPVQKQTVRRWHKKYMREDPADVFFGPSADEIVGTRAAFGCTHYARAFIAVVKALEIISDPRDLRYVISSKADDYNRAMADQDFRATINGHQFVIVRADSQDCHQHIQGRKHTIARGI